MKPAEQKSIEVRLFAYLRRYLPPQGDGRSVRLETTAPDVGTVASGLGIPPSRMGIALLNGRHADADTQLRNGDVLSLFPPIAGG